DGHVSKQPQRPCKILLPHDLANGRRITGFADKNFRCGRPGTHRVEINGFSHGFPHDVMPGETVLGEVVRGLADSGERHSPVTLEPRQPGVDGGGYDTAMNAAPDPAAIAMEHFRIDGTRPVAQPAYRLNIAGLGAI